MSIPLVQDNEKDSINTSIIAIKRNIERINMLLGLVDNDSPDLSGFATKQELQDAVTELQQAVTDLQPVNEVAVDNMQSVTSNAVAEAISKIADYNIAETVVGTCGGKPRYRVIFDDTGVNIPSDQWIVYTYTFVSKNVEKVCKIEGTLKFSFGDTIDINSKYCAFYFNSRSELICYQNYTSSGNNANAYIVVEYTKTTD